MPTLAGMNESERCWCCGSTLVTGGSCPICDRPGATSPPHVCLRSGQIFGDEHSREGLDGIVAHDCLDLARDRLVDHEAGADWRALRDFLDRLGQADGSGPGQT